MIGRKNFTNCEHFEIFHRSKLQSRIIAGERLPSWSLSFIRKIILIIFAAANDCPSLAHRLLMAFNAIEKKNHKTFLPKQYDGVRANIEQKPHRVSLSAILQFSSHYLPLIVISRNLFVYLGDSQNLLKCIANTFIPL